MRAIIAYLREYISHTNKQILLITTVLTALLVWSNYYFGIDRLIRDRDSFTISFLSRALTFQVAFGIPYLGYAALAGKRYFRDRRFVALLLAGPVLFSFKMAFDPYLHFSDDPEDDAFWNYIMYWPLLLSFMMGVLYAVWRTFDRDQPFYGLTTRNMRGRPYWLMLAAMVPLIAAASTQPDFQAVYPKLKLINDIGGFENLAWWRKLLFELSYGSDFVGIELFFRGFLVLAFVKWAGKDAILPMACFYCTIHFGKPLGECISSFFGGALLGIVVYHTRSILGGLMVHLGIAWLMEIGGYLGNSI